MEFEYPNKGYENIKDQFMLGNKYLIAPIVTKDTFSRKVVLPEGEWVDDLGNKYQGNSTIHIEVPLDRIPYFIKVFEAIVAYHKAAEESKLNDNN